MSKKFGILLLTYNRPEYLKLTLRSIANQTYKDIIVYLIDNGSAIPADVSEFCNILDIRSMRYEENQHPSDASQAGLEMMIKDNECTYFVLFSDDDMLVPKALETIIEMFVKNPQMENLTCGFSRYDLELNISVSTREYFNEFTGELFSYKGPASAYAYCNGWGIGAKVGVKLPRLAHASANFFTMELVQKTVDKQKILFVKPFTDVGMAGCLFYTPATYYLDIPLVVLGESSEKGMTGSLHGKRERWLSWAKYVEFSPVKAHTFMNMGLESHLKVIYYNNLQNSVDISIRPDFYFRHLEQILSDEPTTCLTKEHYEESIPHVLTSIQKFFSISENRAMDILNKFKMDTLTKLGKDNHVL